MYRNLRVSLVSKSSEPDAFPKKKTRKSQPPHAGLFVGLFWKGVGGGCEGDVWEGEGVKFTNPFHCEFDFLRNVRNNHGDEELHQQHDMLK